MGFHVLSRARPTEGFFLLLEALRIIIASLHLSPPYIRMSVLENITVGGQQHMTGRTGMGGSCFRCGPPPRDDNRVNTCHWASWGDRGVGICSSFPSHPLNFTISPTGAAPLAPPLKSALVKVCLGQERGSPKRRVCISCLAPTRISYNSRSGLGEPSRKGGGGSAVFPRAEPPTHDSRFWL